MSVMLEKPEVVGEIPSWLLESQVKTHKGYFEFAPLKHIPRRNQRVVTPLVEAVAACAGRAMNKSIRVMVDRHVVQPGEAHLAFAQDWHRDNGEAFTVASALPTEYVNGHLKPGYRPWWDELDTPDASAYKQLADGLDPDITQDSGLTIWRAEPGQVLRQDYPHIHRSPATPDDQYIVRVFAAFVFPGATPSQ